VKDIARDQNPADRGIKQLIQMDISVGNKLPARLVSDMP
jgi:hypothetical protein